MFAAYVSNKGHAFIDRQLYLPKAWAHDLSRRAGAHVPTEVAFATKPQLARAMIELAIGAGVPFAWVAADSVYGVSEIAMALRRAGKGYVLGVKGDSQFNSWVGKPLRAGTAGLWTRGLLIRRSLADGERAYFTTWCPAGTPISTLVAVEG